MVGPWSLETDNSSVVKVGKNLFTVSVVSSIHHQLRALYLSEIYCSFSILSHYFVFLITNPFTKTSSAVLLAVFFSSTFIQFSLCCLDLCYRMQRLGQDGEQFVRIRHGCEMLTLIDCLCLDFGYETKNDAKPLERYKNFEASSGFPHPTRFDRQTNAPRGGTRSQ